MNLNPKNVFTDHELIDAFITEADCLDLLLFLSQVRTAFLLRSLREERSGRLTMADHFLDVDTAMDGAVEILEKAWDFERSDKTKKSEA